MVTPNEFQTVDTLVFLIANLVNILLILIFLARARGLERVEHVVGLVLVALAIPLALAGLYNLMNDREWWFVVFPLLLVAFLAVELILDYVLRLDFRHTRLLGPYLLLYYLSLMGMIGYSFLAFETYGFITLTTYFLNLLATWYSYRRVGHGPARGKGREREPEAE